MILLLPSFRCFIIIIIILSVYHPVYKYMGKTPINIYTSPAKERYVRHVVYAKNIESAWVCRDRESGLWAKRKGKLKGWKRDEKTHDSDQIQNKGGENEGWERQEKWTSQTQDSSKEKNDYLTTLSSITWTKFHLDSASAQLFRYCNSVAWVSSGTSA